MSIQIEVPFDALSRPGVAKALADLMVSLGGHSPMRTARPEVAPVAVATQKATPGPVAPAKPAAKEAPKAAATPAKKPSARRTRTRKPRRGQDLSALPADERWDRYVAELPEPSRRFLALLEQKGKLSVTDAVAALGLSSPKAMGGLTGAMARWAPKQGIALPFEARQDKKGSRYWVWTRK